MDDRGQSPLASNDKPPPYTGLRRFWYATLYSLNGLRYAIDEPAFRQEAATAVILSLIAVMLPLSTPLKLILLASHVAVLVVELLNTALECIVDKASPEYHELAKQAKDLGSAAVFLTLLFVMICWGVAIYQLV
jgi:diacylglycerol kinase (ATP)